MRRLLPLPRRCAALLVTGVCCGTALAALPDEIQVYTDDLDDTGRYSLELHVNATPVGVTTPEYDGETVAAHGMRITPEFAYGLTSDLEAGAYLPFVHESNGDLRAAGVKLRLKWVPIKQAGQGPGIFAGLNGELAQVQQQFENGRRGFELRPILGWRNNDWLLAVNPVLDFALEGPERSSAPTFAPCWKAARTVAPGIATGIEYYGQLGTVSDIEPLVDEKQTLYWAIDIDRPPWNLNFGIGRGLTPVTDRWTVKLIVEIPLRF